MSSEKITGVCVDIPTIIREAKCNKQIDGLKNIVRSLWKNERFVPAQKWISVKDELPAPYASVLTCNENYPDDPPAVLYWSKHLECWEPELRCGPKIFIVTHWMPLPEPPKRSL